MKKLYIFIIALLFVPAFMSAKKDKDVVYLFGTSYSYNDSIVYFTEIQPLEGVKLEKGTGFLPNRQFYSYELKDYMNFKEDMPGRTSVILFSEKKSTLQKREAKIKKRLVEKEGKTVRYLGDKFKFTKP